MEYTIANDHLQVKIKAKGAELSSVYNPITNIEYMWSADPAFWAKSSPVLFPIVGALKENVYNYKGKSYTLSRHGFARDEMFQVEDQLKDSITFLLKSNAVSLEKYPFHFELRIQYQLIENSLRTIYEVKNSGNEEMYFSLGAHPAFKVPLCDGLHYDDYYLQLNAIEKTNRWPITKDGLIAEKSEPFLNDTNRIKLTHELFKHDAIVLKQLHSNSILLKSDRDLHGLNFHFEGYPFLGLWAAPKADFVCIEPWCGIADSVLHNQQLITKEGIEKLDAGLRWTKQWSVDFY